MRGFVDLHCHWIAGIDDGARTADEGVLMLEGLRAAGFETVVATPHMRPSMFDNDRPLLTQAFAAMTAPLVDACAAGRSLPGVHLSSEHFLDDIVFQRLMRGEGLPYPGGGAALVELPSDTFPVRLAHRFFDLTHGSVAPVLAHPERYKPVWDDVTCLEPLLDAGAHLLLDLCALVGKYGRSAQSAAEQLLLGDAYEAACSDAHRPSDIEKVERAIERLVAMVGPNEAERLLVDGPTRLLTLARR